jgi:hypothetical protein
MGRGICGRGIPTIIGATLLLAGSVANAQVDRATLYRDPGFRGPAVAVERADPNMQLGFEIFSVRIAGVPWELCPEPNYRGRCLTVGQSTSDLRRTFGWQGPLRSLRPAGSGGGSGGPVGGQSLRGMVSEFYPAPRQGGQRVLACPRGSATATCAAATADRMCRDAGWNGASHQTMQTANGRTYLADVLCVRSGY